MTVPRLRRNRYQGDGTSVPPHDSKNHAEDMRDFHLPLATLHQTGLHVSGVLDGLQVHGTPGATTLTVDAGVAIDATGRLIVLATDGRADLGPNPPGGDHDEQTVPVTLPLPPTPGRYCLTIRFNELLRAGEGVAGRLEQAPWLRLQPATVTDDGTAVVLAVLETATETGEPAPRLRTLAAGHPDVATARRTAGRRMSELALTTATTSADTITDTIAGRIQAHPDGGLTVDAAQTHATGALSVARALTVTGTAAVTGALTVTGTTNLAADLTVAGTTNLAADLTVATALTAGALRTTGPLHADGTTTLTEVRATGTVGVGTAQPSAQLSVVAPGAPEIAGTAQSAVLRTSAGPLGTGVGEEVALSSFGLVVDNANNVSLGVRAIRIAAGPPGWPSVAIGLGMDVDNTVRPHGAGLLFHQQGRVEVRGSLEVGDDVSLSGKHALRGNDTYLRLNQNGAFPDGVHIGRRLSLGSLNLGAVNGWAFDPGPGNAAIAGNLSTGGSVSIAGNVSVAGRLAGGDITLAGRIGVIGQPATPRTPGWAGGIRTWDLEVEASTWCHHGVETGPRDLAENHVAGGPLSPGDVVCLHPDDDTVVCSTAPHDAMVCGVVSTKPGFLLNSPRDDDTGPLVPVALAGRVPCKVVAENGGIRRGDLLTTSSTPGHAMKASPVGDEPSAYAPGTIVGKALEACSAATGEIEVFVMAR